MISRRPNKRTLNLFLILLYLTTVSRVAEARLIPPRAHLQENWGLRQINKDHAWQISRGSKKIVVAVIDTGIDENHPALRDSLWTNPKEKLNGIDDDGNGFVDDIHGWDYTTSSKNLTDHHGHGTHIAGIIHSIAPEVKLMAVKYYDPQSKSTQNLKNSIKAIEYAIKMGANIINYSGGGPEPSVEESAVIREAQAKGILFVAAAGNEKTNNDALGFFPASYDLPNIVSVTAIDSNINILKSSNYGQISVDIAAPGKDIYSTLPGGRYGKMTGTSQATAFVSGVSALIMSKHATTSDYPYVIRALHHTGKIQTSLFAKTSFGIQLDSFRSLAIEDEGFDAFGTAIRNSENIDTSLFTSTDK